MKLPMFLSSCVSFLLFHGLFGAVHELGHVLAGLMVGCYPLVSVGNLVSLLTARQVNIETKGWRTVWVRHAGWVFSMMVTGVVGIMLGASSIIFCAALVTALEASLSDLLQLPQSNLSLFWIHFFLTTCAAISFSDCWSRGSRGPSPVATLASSFSMPPGLPHPRR